MTRALCGVTSIAVHMKDPAHERNEVLCRLDLASTHLETMIVPSLIKTGGVSLGYAVRGARDNDGIAAVPGGIVLHEGKVTAGRPCAFGADEACARIVLTTMKFDPHIRSAATIPFSENVLAVFRAMLMECASVDSRHTSPQISTMDWGIAACCNDGVPDIIYDRGGDKKPGFIHIFGEEPLVVANNIIICSNRI